MKLVTFLYLTEPPKTGVLTEDGDRIIDLMAAHKALKGSETPFFTSMLDFLSGGEKAREAAEEIRQLTARDAPETVIKDLGEVTLLSPVPRPESIRDCMAFERHIMTTIRRVGLKKFSVIDEWLEKKLGKKWSLAYQLNKEWYERPIYYKSNRLSVVGTEADVVIPRYCSHFDYELEWGIYIGKKGVDIPVTEAAAYIGGYTVFNDFSARDIQMKEMKGRLGPAKGKDFATGNAIGPYLVTPDEIKDPYNLTMTAAVNGQEWSRGSSKEMYWSFEDIIAYISRSEPLYPGEFIGSGTCSGSEGAGCGLEMGRRLQKGDLVELNVEKIGVLSNRVV